MKLALTGKGGVGKTTVAAIFSRVLKDRGYKVILIDADPDMNLATVLGVPRDVKVTPIVEMKELIAENGVQPGQSAPFFKMNPRVDDIPDRTASPTKPQAPRHGNCFEGGGGCACPRMHS